MKYVKSESATYPELVDITSSKKYVYLRKNVVEKQREHMGKTTTYYEYEEAKLTKAEYEDYTKGLAVADIQQQRADIDYIMLMTGLEV